MSGASSRRAALLLMAAGVSIAQAPPASPPAGRESAYRANNRGVALLEQFRQLALQPRR